MNEKNFSDLHYFSYCSQSIKQGLAQTLFLRAYRVCDEEYLSDECDFICDCLKKLAYPQRMLDVALRKAKQVFFRRKNDSELDDRPKRKCLFLPYMPMLEMKKANLRKFDTDIIFKYNNKVSNRLCKNRPKAVNVKEGAGVYKIPCGGCEKVYFGESGRDLSKRVKEHKKDIERMKEESAIANHVKDCDHFFNFDDAEVLVPCSDVRKRHVIESALIRCHQNEAVNLNLGFSPNNELFSHYIRELFYQRSSIT